MNGKIATILGKKSFTNDNKEVFHIIEHSLDDDAVFVSKEQYDMLKLYQTCLVVTKKYKKDNAWKSSRSIIPVSLG